MTLVVTVNGPESIWALVDRRLSHPQKSPRDDARKIMFLNTTDGQAILACAGLGATARGTEPADWMSAVLRGRSLPLEASLEAIADAMKHELPRHLKHAPGPGAPSHHIIASAFVGNEPKLYTIDMVVTADRRHSHFRFTRHGTQIPGSQRLWPPRIAIAGSGAEYLYQDKRWIRNLLPLVRAHDRGHASAFVVADALARLNQQVHKVVADKSVGPRCIVAWRYRNVGLHKRNSAHQFYTGLVREPAAPSIPSIGFGLDIRAVADVVMSHLIAQFDRRAVGQSTGTDLNLDLDSLNAVLARLPERPDEILR